MPKSREMKLKIYLNERNENTMKKTLAILLALVMILSLATAVFADESTTQTVTVSNGSGSITITNPAEGETYKIIKLFDATVSNAGIAYTGTIPDGLGDYFELVNGYVQIKESAKDTTDTNKLSSDAIAALKTWAEAQDEDSVTSSAEVEEGKTSLVFAGLDYGYYVVTTTQGSVISVTSTNPEATVTDKNTAPTVEKDITKVGEDELDEAGKAALAQVGTTVEFKVTITVGTGAKNYVFHDTMDSRLSYNNDATVTGVDSGKYTIKGTPDEGDTITITFEDGIAANTEITITYSATVTSDALTTETTAAGNTAYISYGDSSTTTSDTVNVYNAKFTVTKKDGSGNALAGAGFVIAKTVADTSDGAEEGATKTVYYKLENGVVSWVDSIDDATEYTSDSTGAVTAFTGLANGTYTLVEKTVPAGYNKAADIDFTIANGSYTAANLEQTATVTNNAGSELPSTGGIGTTLFYIFGGILVVGAVVVLVTKRRMNAEG